MELATVGATQPDRFIEPIPLDHVPDVHAALSRLRLGSLLPDGLSGLAGRNHNWAGHTADGREMFVKHLTGPVADRGDRYERTLAFERLVAERPFRTWRSPGFIAADQASRVLVFENILDAAAVAALDADDALDEDLARWIGSAVGELHARPVGAVGPAAGRAPRNPDRLSALDLEDYVDSSAASLEVWALLHHDRRLLEALDRLAEQSAAAPPVLSHSDLRLDQFLLSDGNLYIVDWEEFRPADPAVDVGSVVGEWLMRAASRMFADLDPELGTEAGPVHEALMAKGERELDAVRPLVAACWSGYRAERSSYDAGLPQRATAYAGWHLYDRMMASAMFSGRLGATQKGIAGIGRNAVMRPQQFVDVIGFGGSDDA